MSEHDPVVAYTASALEMTTPPRWIALCTHDGITVAALTPAGPRKETHETNHRSFGDGARRAHIQHTRRYFA